eukprot:743465-Rhodomonas_salina.5
MGFPGSGLLFELEGGGAVVVLDAGAAKGGVKGRARESERERERARESERERERARARESVEGVREWSGEGGGGRGEEGGEGRGERRNRVEGGRGKGREGGMASRRVCWRVGAAREVCGYSVHARVAGVQCSHALTRHACAGGQSRGVRGRAVKSRSGELPVAG